MRRRSRERERVLVLGGGFAGLAAALELPSDRYAVTLVDRNPWFEFLPNIHELLSGVKTPELLRIPLAPSLAQVGHAFEHDTVTALDADAQTVSTSGGARIGYDALIVALGGVDATRGVSGVAEHSMPFKSVEQCHRIGRRLSALARRRDPANVVIIGGGLGGVEALGEILRRYRGDDLHVRVVEARDRLLPEAPAALDEIVRSLCEPHAVDFLLESPVSRIEARSVSLQDGRSLPSDLTIWTGGPTAPGLLAEFGLAPPGDWAPVEETLRSKEQERIFVAGDACALPTPLAKQGYYALDMGVHAARNAKRLLAGRELRRFRPSGKPTLISFGDLTCFLVAGERVVSAPALAAAKEAVFELVMTQLDPRPSWRRLPRVAARADRAARELLWPSISSWSALGRQWQVSVR